MPIGLIKEKLLFVEGKDEVNFFDSLLKFLNIDFVQILPYGGKYNFPNEIPSIVRHPDFHLVKQIGCIRDADNDSKAAFASVFNTLKKNGLEPSAEVNRFSQSIPSIGIFIMPGKVCKSGILEDLCLNSINDDGIIKFVDNYFVCIDKPAKEKYNNISKRKIQVYLASMVDICATVGLAAKKKYWNFESEVYDELKNFLKKFNF